MMDEMPALPAASDASTTTTPSFSLARLFNRFNRGPTREAPARREPQLHGLDARGQYVSPKRTSKRNRRAA